ncbi:MAG: helix-turn-helix domain-containing protein [Gemmatimonas sp.]
MAKQLGRPKLTKRDIATQAKRRRAEGERLQQALGILGISQAEAVRRSGVSYVNDIANGQADASHEALRKLGRIGVSPEFILGLTDEHISPGQSRTTKSLERDLAAAAVQYLDATFPPTGLKIAADRRWAVLGDRLLAKVLERVHDEAQREVELAEQAHIHSEALDAIHGMLDTMYAGSFQAFRDAEYMSPEMKTELARIDKLYALVKKSSPARIGKAEALTLVSTAIYEKHFVERK